MRNFNYLKIAALLSVLTTIGIIAAGNRLWVVLIIAILGGLSVGWFLAEYHIRKENNK